MDAYEILINTEDVEILDPRFGRLPIERVKSQTYLSFSECEQTRRKSTLNLEPLNLEPVKYPTVYFASDTTGEKAYEEFYVPGEKIDMQRFQALGVVEETTRHEMDEVNGFFEKLEGIFAKDTFTKAQVVEAIKEFLPNFQHEETGKNLDQKM